MRLARLAAALLPLALAACSVGGDAEGVAVSFSGADTGRAVVLDEGDVAVTSTDGAVVLMVVGDTVRMQLSDSLRASVRAEVDSSVAEDGGAVGGMLARSIGKVVGGAMGFVLRVPVDEVENVRYEDGRIRFETRGNTKFSMGNRGDGDDRRNGVTFSPEDGERFVETVKARQRDRGF